MHLKSSMPGQEVVPGAVMTIQSFGDFWDSIHVATFCTKAASRAEIDSRGPFSLDSLSSKASSIGNLRIENFSDTEGGDSELT